MDNLRYPVIRHWIPTPSRRRPGRPITPAVRFLVAHDTGNPGSTAMDNARYFANTPNPAPDQVASAHFFVDDVAIVESVPALGQAPETAFHVLYNVATDNRLYGVDANDAALAVEYCYGGSINADHAYARYVHLLAWLCRNHRLDPRFDIVGHYLLDPRRRTDPVTGLAHSGRSYEQLLRDVAAEFVDLGGELAAIAPVTADQALRLASTVRLNLRGGRASRLAPIVRTVPAGTELHAVGSTEHGENVAGRALWYRTAADEWFWSGGVAML